MCRPAWGAHGRRPQHAARSEDCGSATHLAHRHVACSGRLALQQAWPCGAGVCRSGCVRVSWPRLRGQRRCRQVARPELSQPSHHCNRHAHCNQPNGCSHLLDDDPLQWLSRTPAPTHHEHYELRHAAAFRWSRQVAVGLPDRAAAPVHGRPLLRAAHCLLVAVTTARKSWDRDGGALHANY